jgi:hypothetical protein
VTTADTLDVESAVVRGTLTTPDGAPVPNAFVRVTAVAGGRSYADVTGKDGTWQVGNVDPENYRISFEIYAGDTIQYAYGQATAGQAQVFTLAPGSTTVVDDTWVLGNTLRVTATDGDVEGTVRDTTGTPMPLVNVDVTAWPLGGTPPWQETFPDGTYRIGQQADRPGHDRSRSAVGHRGPAHGGQRGDRRRARRRRFHPDRRHLPDADHRWRRGAAPLDPDRGSGCLGRLGGQGPGAGNGHEDARSHDRLTRIRVAIMSVPVSFC